MNAANAITIPEFSQSTHSLSKDELRAALRAIHRILVVARDMNRWGTTQADMERILDATENLPTMLLRPAEYEDLFAGTLASLAAEFPAMHGIADEYDKSVREIHALEMIAPVAEKQMAKGGEGSRSAFTSSGSV